MILKMKMIKSTIEKQLSILLWPINEVVSEAVFQSGPYEDECETWKMLINH